MASLEVAGLEVGELEVGESEVGEFGSWLVWKLASLEVGVSGVGI
jgi:hypothetical protein